MENPAFDKEKPYNDLPGMPPAVELETRAVLKKAIAANASLAKLAGKEDQLPHQGILINSIVLQESKASSEIENIFTTQDDLYRAGVGSEAGSTPEAKEVRRYRQALWSGFNAIKVRPLCTNTVIDVVREIKGTDIGIRTGEDTRIANQFGQVVYTPPVGEERIRDMLADLEQFIHAEDDLDPLVRMAVIHYQFEAIHPFADGNGRAGRILNLLYLVHEELLSIPVLYLSKYIIENKGDYYARLRGVTEDGDWEAWLLYMLQAIDITSNDTIKLINDIRSLMEWTLSEVAQKAPNACSKELIELLFTEPYCKIGWLVDAGIAKRHTASSYLKQLVEIGILHEHKFGREKVFINTRLIGLLR